MLLKIFKCRKITQTSSANSEHKHSKIKRFSMLNERFNRTVVKTQKTPSLSVVSKFSDLH